MNIVFTLVSGFLDIVGSIFFFLLNILFAAFELMLTALFFLLSFPLNLFSEEKPAVKEEAKEEAREEVREKAQEVQEVREEKKPEKPKPKMYLHSFEDYWEEFLKAQAGNEKDRLLKEALSRIVNFYECRIVMASDVGFETKKQVYRQAVPLAKDLEQCFRISDAVGYLFGEESDELKTLDWKIEMFLERLPRAA